MNDQNADPERGHAIVIGGSLAGLLAARVLAHHFQRVTILEKDAVGDRPESRKGQPQTRQGHGLLASGFNVMRRLFPDLEQELVDAGATIGDMGELIRWHHFGGYKAQSPSGFVGVTVGRPFLEWQVRRRVLARDNVTLCDEAPVRELLLDSSGERVCGVEVAADGANGSALGADLVLDASGRGSRTPQWLAQLGFEPPVEDEVVVRVGYATRLYRRQEGDLEGAKLVLMLPTPPAGTRMSFMLPIEDERWIVTAGGWHGDYPPTDPDGFHEFLRSQDAPDIYDVASRAEPLTDPVPHRFRSSLRRRYDRLKHFPDGLAVLGDAVASFNPVYAQGMTSAAMQAEALDEVLTAHPSLNGIWRPLFRRLAKVVDLSWQAAVGEDFRFPQTEGPKPTLIGAINAYVARVHRATHHDPVVYRQFLRVMNMLDPVTALLAPGIAWRVLARKDNGSRVDECTR